MDRLTIRSYRRVFRVDRRLYRVDRWALPVPGGVPLRGLGYFGIVLALVVFLDNMAVTGALLDQLAPPLRYVLLPLVVAVLGMQATPDGRPTHRFALAWLLRRVRAPRRSLGHRVPLEGEGVAWKGSVRVRHDHDSPVLQRVRVQGPVSVRFRDGVRFGLHPFRSHRWTARPGGPVTEHDLGEGEDMEVRP